MPTEREFLRNVTVMPTPASSPDFDSGEHHATVLSLPEPP
jgi:hypothetical protein